MSGNGRLPAEGGMNNYINEYPFLQHPTTANENEWAAVAAPAISGHQAAALIHHTRNHAKGITKSLKEQGVAPTKAQNQVQTHLAFLRDNYDGGQWHHPAYPPTQTPPPLDVLTPLVTMTTLCREHAPGQSPYHLLWGDQGFVLQAIRAAPRGRLTRATASQGLRRLRQAFRLPEPPNRHRKTPAAAAPVPAAVPASAAVAATTPAATPVPTTPSRAARSNQILGGISPLSALSPSAAAAAAAAAALASPQLDKNEEKEKPAAPRRRQTPSPPPMPEDGYESDVSASGIVMQLFSQPNLPLAPSSRKFKAVRAAGLAAHAKEDKRRRAAETRRLNKEKKEAAILASKKREEEEGEGEEEEKEEGEEEGLSLETREEIADDIATAAARAASRVAKRKWGHVLPPARRGVVTRRVRAKASEAVLKTI